MKRPQSKFARGRQRRKAGRQVVAIEIGPVAIEALLVAGLSEPQSRDPRAVREALEAVIEGWALKIVRRK